MNGLADLTVSVCFHPCKFGLRASELLQQAPLTWCGKRLCTQASHVLCGHQDRLRRRELRDDALRAAGLRDRFLLATARPNESTDRDLSRRMRRREPSLLS